jgi:hypothetical protein
MVPEQVTIAMAEIAEDMREGLLALAVGTGLQVMGTLMDADVTAVCGPRGKHDPDRAAVRHGHERGSVTLGGRRVPVERPRVRAADGSGELPVPSYELFSSTELLGRMALERAVQPPLPGRTRAGRGAHGGDREGDEQVGGVAQVRGHDRDRVGGHARRRPVRAGSGGVDGRRGALRRALLRGRAGHRPGRDEASARPGRGIDGERHAGHRSAGRPARAGTGRDPADPRRARWVEGAGGRGAQGVRPPGDPEMSTSQDRRM